MCIKVHRTYCCPVLSPTPDQGDTYTEFWTKLSEEYFEGQEPDVNGVLSNMISDGLGLPKYEGFHYVRHSTESWIRCSGWNVTRCFDDELPTEIRSLAFKRACPGCSGYDKCLSQRNDPEQFDESTIYHSPLGAYEYETGLRSQARYIFECVLRSEITRYRVLTNDKRFDYTYLFPKSHGDKAHEELLPFIMPLVCTQDKKHIGCTVDGDILACGPGLACINETLVESHNLLRAMYRSSAQSHASVSNDSGSIICVMHDKRFFDEVENAYKPQSFEQE